MPTGSPSDEPPASDVEKRERAFVNPDDVRQLGDPESTQEKIEAMLERVKAEQNTPDGLLSQAAKWMPALVCLLLGWWFGTQSGGGGGSEDGGSAASSPVMLDIPGRAMDLAAQAPALALDVGVGVI